MNPVDHDEPYQAHQSRAVGCFLVRSLRADLSLTLERVPKSHPVSPAKVGATGLDGRMPRWDELDLSSFPVDIAFIGNRKVLPDTGNSEAWRAAQGGTRRFFLGGGATGCWGLQGGKHTLGNK